MLAGTYPEGGMLFGSLATGSFGGGGMMAASSGMGAPVHAWIPASTSDYGSLGPNGGGLSVGSHLELNTLGGSLHGGSGSFHGGSSSLHAGSSLHGGSMHGGGGGAMALQQAMAAQAMQRSLGTFGGTPGPSVSDMLQQQQSAADAAARQQQPTTSVEDLLR